MKVFRVSVDVNHYQYFLTSRAEDSLKLTTDCYARQDSWKPPPVYIYRPLHKRGDFFQFAESAIISSPIATEALREFYEMAGELLPLPYKNSIYTLLNVTECINCLDEEKTAWAIDSESGKKLHPEKYVFHPDRFSASVLFKIPQTCRGEVLLVEGCSELEYEFREVIEEKHLEGLIFEELWSG